MSEINQVPSEPVRFNGNKPLPADTQANPNLPQNLWESIVQNMRWNSANVLHLNTARPYREPAPISTHSIDQEVKYHDDLRKEEGYTDKRNLASFAGMLFVSDELAQKEFAGKTVLEIGSGSGNLAHDLSQAGATVTELDYSQVALDSSTGLRKLRASGIAIPAGDATFDRSIAMFSTTMYTGTITARLRSFTEAFRITRPGGRSFVLPVFADMVLRSQRWFEGHNPKSRGHMTSEEEFVMRQQAAMDYATGELIEQLFLNGYVDFTPVLAQEKTATKTHDIVSGIFDIKNTLTVEKADEFIEQIGLRFKTS